MARSPSGSSGTSTRSVEINGRTVTDPAQVDRIERNREASARYAAADYARDGTPIPRHLESYVERQAAERSNRGTGTLGLPDPMSGRITSIGPIYFDGGGGGGRVGDAMRSAGSAIGSVAQRGFQAATGFTGLRDVFDGGGRGASANRAPPSAAPGTFASLGPPGSGREDNDPNRRFGSFGPQPAPEPERPSPDAGMSGEEVSRRNAERSQVPTYEEGGYVGKGGQPIRPSTASMDLPPALARLMDMPMQSYQVGGMVGPGGMPQRPMTSPMAMQLAQQGGAPVVGVAPPGQQGRPLNFAAIDQQAQQFMQQNPQQVEQIRAQVQQAMAAGEVDAQSLNMFVQVATTALQNPEMWPQLRQVLIRQGMLDASEIDEEYDQGFLIVLYIIGKTMGGGMGGGAPAPTGGAPAAPMGGAPAPMSAGQPAQMSMQEGGALPAKSENPDGSIPINAHEGEYVIPADVTRRLGTDHFDKLIAKARGADGKGEA